MTPLSRLLSAAACAASICAAGSALAASPAGDPGIKALKLSAEMARAGRERHDPWLLVTAAKLRREEPVQTVDRTPENASGDVSAFDPAETWLNEAEEMSSGDGRLSGLIAEVRTQKFKGRSGGPKVSTARLIAGGTHRYGEVFDPRKPAVVYVEGDGDSQLALVVRDGAGAEACAEAGPGDVKICSWMPDAAAAYHIEISNQGRVDDRYAVATN